MQATADALDLSPPPPKRGWGSGALALLVHGLLAAALTWGVSWQHDAPTVAVEAELWSALPQAAAPRAQEPDPEPAPETPPTPLPPPKPDPAPPRPAPAAAPTPPKADIATAQARERERQAREQAQQRQQQAREKQAREQAAREQKAREQKAREQAQAKADQARAAREAAQREADRQKQLERIMGQAQATGAAGATGTAARASGPSASYAGRLAARIRPNIVFADTVPGNPLAEVEVRALPDGTIVGSRLIKTSGHSAWDNAVLRAVERTGTLPRDENGRVPPTLIIGFKPQE